MDLPTIKGVVAKQAHVAIPDGTTEEEFARNGFFGNYAHLYRTQPLVNWLNIEGPLKPRAYDFNSQNSSTDFIQSRKSMLSNSDVRIIYSVFDTKMDYCVRNADADELYFIHEGSGSFHSDFGKTDYTSGDYLIIPRGTIQQWLPKSKTKALLMESFSEVGFPDKGILGQHALIDPACIETPTAFTYSEIQHTTPTKLKIKRLDQWTTVEYPFHPLNVVGWKGNLSVKKLNVKDIRPIMSERYHLPPTAHATFVAKNFVVCTFLPRSLENGDPEALKVPFYHLNIDYDEVLFYHSGDFFSRTGIKPGMLTFHPQGIEHGPQKGAIDRAKAATRTEEVAIMIDTINPLKASADAEFVENKDYYKSWR